MWTGSTFSPSTFFRALPRSGGTGPAVLYYLALAVLVAGVDLFWAVVLRPAEGAPWMERLGVPASPTDPLVGFMLSPLIMLCALFIGAVLAHAPLAILGGARHGLGTTIRVYCYAYSPALFVVVPWLGTLVALIWTIALAIIGLREAHQTTGVKATIAVMLPFLLLLMLGVLAAVLLLSGLLLLPAA